MRLEELTRDNCNFDILSEKELKDIHIAIASNPQKYIDQIGVDELTLNKLLTYIDMKHQAIKHRLSGECIRAMILENRAEYIYQSLPLEWQW